jgi:hypothetical protein
VPIKEKIPRLENPDARMSRLIPVEMRCRLLGVFIGDVGWRIAAANQRLFLSRAVLPFDYY